MFGEVVTVELVKFGADVGADEAPERQLLEEAARQAEVGVLRGGGDRGGGGGGGRGVWPGFRRGLLEAGWGRGHRRRARRVFYVEVGEDVLPGCSLILGNH